MAVRESPLDGMEAVVVIAVVAVAAVRPPPPPPILLPAPDALDGRDVLAIRGKDRVEAGVHRGVHDILRPPRRPRTTATANEDGASAAPPLAAPELRPRQAQFGSEEVQQRLVRTGATRDGGRDETAVDVQDGCGAVIVRRDGIVVVVPLVGEIDLHDEIYDFLLISR